VEKKIKDFIDGSVDPQKAHPRLQGGILKPIRRPVTKETCDETRVIGGLPCKGGRQPERGFHVGKSFLLRISPG